MKSVFPSFWTPVVPSLPFVNNFSDAQWRSEGMWENCNKRVLLVWQTSASGHIHKWTKSLIFERNGRLWSSLICQMCGDYHCYGPDLTIRNGQNFMMPCPLGLSQWELVSQGTRLDLLWLYQSWLLGCCWLISILGSFLVRSASEAFNSYHSEIH